MYGGPDWLWFLPRLIVCCSLLAVLGSPVVVALWVRGCARTLLLALVAVAGLVPLAALATLFWLATTYPKSGPEAPAWADSFILPAALLTVAAMVTLHAAVFLVLMRTIRNGRVVPGRVFGLYLAPYAAQSVLAALFLLQETVLATFGPAALRQYVSSLDGVASLLVLELVFLAVMAGPVAGLWLRLRSAGAARAAETRGPEGGAT